MNSLSLATAPVCDEPRFEGKALRQLFGHFATGITVITTRTQQGKHLGLTASSFSAVSLDPPLILWSLRKNSPHLEEYCQSDYFAIHFLTEQQQELSNHFARPAEDKFAGMAHTCSEQGPPLLPNCLGQLICQNTQQIDAGDHVILLGEIEAFEHHSAKPLLFFRGAYAALGDDI